MQSRQVARELALLSLSQMPTNPEKISEQEIPDFIIAAIRTLTTEVKEALEEAAGELQRADDRLLHSQTRAVDLQSARTMLQEAIQLASQAINRMGSSVEIPEFIQLSNQKDVRNYAENIVRNLMVKREEVDELLSSAMVDWQLNRLARIDRDILRIAVCEILFLGVPERIAINEAVELAKRYSGEDGYRFINGVLRRVSDKLKTPISS
ncbi:transcription antitermination factor NusB [[Phormidium ambiguum] IAM M-71]|uniref:Transcription antitermination protein NusB n=1 Tax=[Phormidium ambiguum] IAM M-71 TaxID=454136 RepID=A0A1U7IH58_9CYAN|nr:transcription antitermination factor NusB [Phormidium ambiguum]OKH36355.1 transcription antitermination factor NusB [Phormidium ambiguum IAM M-71]